MPDEQVIEQNPEVLGGMAEFRGTRVPIKSLFDRLEAGDSIDDFLEGFPNVRREQIATLLEESDFAGSGRGLTKLERFPLVPRSESCFQGLLTHPS